MLALGHRIRRLIDDGDVAGGGEVARLLDITRPRVTQLCKLTQLAPEIQEQILFLEAVDGVEPPITERRLRTVVDCLEWKAQRQRWKRLKEECGINEIGGE